MGSFSADTFSFDCFLTDNEIQTSELIFKTIFFSLFPILLNLISFFFFFSLYCKTYKPQKNRFIVVYIVSSIFLQPTILKLLFQNLICLKIDGESYLKSNLEENCNTNSYYLWFFVFFLFYKFIFKAIYCYLSYARNMDNDLPHFKSILFDKKPKEPSNYFNKSKNLFLYQWISRKILFLVT